MFFNVIKNVRPVQFCMRNNFTNNFSSATTTNIEFCDGVKKITMCDQKSRNSLSLAMMKNLQENITKDKDNQALRVIIIAAEGSVFSAGHNLKELTTEGGKSQQEDVFRLASELMYSIIDCPVPVIAQVDGLAAAAGCQLVAQCDIALCTENSKFSTPGANFGIFCSTPGIPLARKVQKSTALHMLLTGLPITAAEAKSCGLITNVYSKENLDQEVKVICDAIISKSRSVIELGKRFYYKQVDLNIREAYKLGSTQMVENLGLRDGKEGIRSFVEKRKPVWSHSNN